MAKLNKPVFKKTIAITIGFVFFMLITNLSARPQQPFKVILGSLASGVMVWMVLYFAFMWQDRRVEKK